jgi:hypothetical protein
MIRVVYGTVVVSDWTVAAPLLNALALSNVVGSGLRVISDGEISSTSALGVVRAGMLRYFSTIPQGVLILTR